MLTLVTIPCLEDNYTFLLHDPATGETVVVDVPDAAPVLAELEARNWRLTEIWLTHHDWDHIQGVPELVNQTGAKVIGAKADAHRLPALDTRLESNESFTFAGHQVETFEVPGHTIGHIAFYVPAAKVAFTGDSLMAMGCGRLWEGTHQQAYDSLCRISALPSDTTICSGHEYTTSNIAFAVTIEPDNQALAERAVAVKAARANNTPTVPSLLSLEQETNPFLRAHLPSVKAALHMESATDAEVFTEIRTRKDNF